MKDTKKNQTAEEKKNKLDLRPALEFVQKHIHSYETGFHSLMEKPVTGGMIPDVSYMETNLLVGDTPQIMPSVMKEIMGRLPRSVLELSQLTTVNFESTATVPVPVFNDTGTWVSVEMVPVSKFPRHGDHPSRILIGRSTGKVIYPSALPASVYGGDRARWFYQLHVFLHEFFHTVEYLRRNTEVRQAIKLVGEKNTFTFEDWWQKWENFFASASKMKFSTRYAATYGDSLTQEVRERDPALFTRAVAEQICESFAGYILGIAPNDDDNPKFSDHSPGTWILIDELASAEIAR